MCWTHENHWIHFVLPFKGDGKKIIKNSVVYTVHFFNIGDLTEFFFNAAIKDMRIEFFL